MCAFSTSETHDSPNRYRRNSIQVSSYGHARSISIGGVVSSVGRSLFGDLLKPEHRLLLQRERDVLLRLRALANELAPGTEDAGILGEAIAQVDDVFMVVCCGEFNAGKSTFVNALLGGKFVEEGVLPTTAKINILRRGRENDQIIRRPYVDPLGNTLDDVEEVLVPVDWLEKVALVDTPGTNAVILRHERLTQRIVPRADIVIFLTSADRPFSESERKFLEQISGWRKKVVLVVNKMDILETAEQKHAVEDFVRRNGSDLLGGETHVFSVSARDALQAKISAKPQIPSVGPGAKQWKESQFEALEAHMHKVLSVDERIRAKILSPLGVAERILESSLTISKSRLKTLETDLATLKLVDEQMHAFMQDMERDIRYETLQVSRLVSDMVNRAESFFDRRFRIMEFTGLFDSKKLQKDFDNAVLADLRGDVARVTLDLSSLVASRARTQSLAVLDYVGRRPGNHADGMLGKVQDTHFEGLRRDLLGSLGDAVENVMKGYTKERELELLTDTVHKTLLQATAVQVGAAVGGLAAAHVFDPSGGILTASGLAISGLLVMPWQRRRAKQAFKERAETIGKSMDKALATHLDRELRHVHTRIMDSVAPYARFVRVETTKSESITESLCAVQRDLRDLRKEAAKV